MNDNNPPDLSIIPDTKTVNSAGKSLSQIADLVKNSGEIQGRKIPPVDQWNPQHCGKMNLTVKSNGEWWHEGSLIKREALVKLFSSVLWYENGTYFLKTPVEKIEIDVEDVPLLVTSIDQVEQDGQLFLRCTTQTDDVIVVDAEHPIFMRDYAGQQRPYIRVRWDLEALIQRSAFYHLINLGEFDAQGTQTVLRVNSGDYQVSLVVDSLAE